MTQVYLLKLKTQKVQSFIFKVPKLKSMLGANSLLGEFFAVDLPDLRKKHGDVPKYFKDLTKDSAYKWESDDIYENFKNGIIASAGGHFEAIFCNKDDAKGFLQKAIHSANEKIPGVGISYYLKSVKYKKDNNDNNDIISYKEYEDKDSNSEIVKNVEIKDIEENFYYIDSPFFYPSEKDGENPELLNNKDNSLITSHIEKQGNDFYEQKSKDYLSEFYQKFQKGDFYTAFTSGKKYKRYKEKDLSTLKHASLIPHNNMIAVIATDGNGMGNRFTEKRKELKSGNKTLFEALIEIEKFWFKARNGFRNALEKSIKEIAAKSDNFTEYDTLPFVIMMLGGDDLLVVTVPELAFEFVTEFNKNLYDNQNKITSCSGIAFVKHNYPFSHAHELAESLLDSAKKLSKMERNRKDEAPQGLPAVDWHFQYSSLYNDIEEIRERDYILSYSNQTEILSMRPYLAENLMTLKDKSEKVFKKYNEDKLKGRNKYKKLRELIKEGKEASEHYMNLFLEKDDQKLFEYEDIGNNIHLNNSLDIIEMLELNERKGDK